LNYLPTLDNLNLSRNCIYRIKGLNMQLNIKELNLSHNFIERIQGLEELIQLSILDLSYNKITDIKEIKNLKKNRKLHSLSIEENPFIGIT
jgi:Leucine-rich repeat (LRR) protein